MKCPEMANAAPKGCDGCGRALVGRQRRWCANRECERWWSENHRWTDARFAALKLARVSTPGDHGGWLCARCHVPTAAPEVNHKAPALGKHHQNGCWHHQENLEVLCHPCHVEETRQQRAAGLLRSNAAWKTQ